MLQNIVHETSSKGRIPRPSFPVFRGEFMKSLCLAIVFVLFSFPHALAMTGAEVLEQQRSRHSVASAKCRAEMALVDAKGHRETRTLTLMTRENGEARDFLAVFLAPDDIRGAALLAKMPAQGTGDLFLYLPAADAVQRISEASKKNSFLGSDFTYEDLEPERIENFNYRILRSEMLEEQNCWVIEAVPADSQKARQSAYSKRILWITKAHLATLRVEFYDRRERLVKSLANRDILVWRPRTAIMESALTGHKTILTLVGEEEINISLEDSLFTTEALKEQVHCR